jgi:hypothetical protein
MRLTKAQISVFLKKNKIGFKLYVNSGYIISFDRNDYIYTLIELERLCKSNKIFWDNYYEDKNEGYLGKWSYIYDKIQNIWDNLYKLKDLDLQSVKNILSNNTQRTENVNDSMCIYSFDLHSPIDEDEKFNEIRRFLNFYTKYDTCNITDSVSKFIDFYQGNFHIGNNLSDKDNPSSFYTSIYIIKQNISPLRVSISEFDKSVVVPLSKKLNEISNDADRQYEETTKFSEERYIEVKTKFEKIKDEFDTWIEEKNKRLSELEETYKNKLSLEAPEKLWNDFSREHEDKAKKWQCRLLITSCLLILVLAELIRVIYSFSLEKLNQIPFLSETFILISVISFFIYIIRVLVKLIISNQHLSVEYKQKAALTRFYQALTYAGNEIDKEEKLIIMNALFSKSDSGLVKTDGSNDMDTLLAVLSKNIKS